VGPRLLEARVALDAPVAPVGLHGGGVRSLSRAGRAGGLAVAPRLCHDTRES
jgi:hypothetical protein